MPPFDSSPMCLFDNSIRSSTTDTQELESSKPLEVPSAIQFHPSLTRKRAHHVSFHRNVTVSIIPSVKDYSLVERFEIWYSKEEFYDMHEDCLEAIAQMNAGGVSETPNLSFRGLESRRKRGFSERRRARAAAISAVLDEQDRQDASYEDPCAIKIATAYAPCNIYSQEVAQKRAFGDALEARRFLRTSCKSNQKCFAAVSEVLPRLNVTNSRKLETPTTRRTLSSRPTP